MLGLLKPQIIHFSSSLEWVKNKGMPKLKQIKAVGYFMPFLKSLERLITHRDFQKSLKNPSDASFANFFKDVNDGFYYKNHPILCDKDALAIITYCDNIEVTNTLDIKTKKHKLAVFYWHVANIDPAYRSQLSVINLLAVAKTN